MATTYVTLQNLKTYDGNLKTYIDSDKTKSIKGYLKKDNTWNFYNTDAPTEDSTPIFSIDVPVEYFLDQTKTTFVQEFTWSAETYVGSTDPSLEGKPVWVMAVKGDDNTVTYSFVNLETLVDVYTAKETNSITVVVSDTNEISADVKISAEEGNILSAKEDGLFAEADLSAKADKLVNPEDGEAIIKAGQIFIDDGNGNLSASGITLDELKTQVSDDVMSNFDTTTDSDAEIDSWFE